MATIGNTSRAYEVLRELSTGETGATYKALAPETRKTIAVRMIRPGALTAATADIVLENAKRSLQLNSPNIVLAHDAYEEDGVVYVVIDYAEGVTLGNALSESKLSDWDLLDTARQVGAAIDHADSRSVTHPNLNPANIVQEWDGTVKVLDYGVSSDIARQAAASPARLTPACYLSPEQTKGAPPDRRSNIFSLGVILYEMLTGKRPFTAPDAQTLFEQIRTQEPVPPHVVKPKVSPALSKVILKALAKAPEQRHESGAELVRDLENALQKKSETLAPAPARPAAPASGPLGSNANSRQSGLQSATVKRAAATPPATQRTQPTLLPDTDPPPARTATLSRTVQQPTPAIPASRPAPVLQAQQSARKLDPTPANEFLIVGSRPEPNAEPVSTMPAAPATAITPSPAPERTRSAPSLVQRPLIYYCAAAVAVVLIALLVGLLVRPSGRQESTTEAGKPSLSQAAATPQAVTSVEAPVAVVEPEQPVRSQSSKKSKRKEIAAPVAAPALAILTIQSSPEGAAIRMDGQPTTFTTPHTIPQLAAGVHTITLVRSGFDESSKTVELASGQNGLVTFTLTEARGIVAITSDPPGAELAIDGSPTGRVTPVTVALLKGKHSFSFRKAGFSAAAASIEVLPGQNYRVSPRLDALGDASQVKELGKFKKLFGGGRDMAKLQFRSAPKGAQISVNQRVLNKVTPAEFAFPQ